MHAKFIFVVVEVVGLTDEQAFIINNSSMAKKTMNCSPVLSLELPTK